jgi:polyisoprenoid-binding protein YceI
MKKNIGITLALMLVLTACSSPSLTPSPEPLETQVVVTEVPGEAPPATEIPTENIPDPTEPPAETSAPQSGSNPITYQIVPGESTVTYQVGEVFINQGNVFKVAVGITPQVSGEIYANPQNPQNSTLGPIQVDVSQFKSDSDRRDNAIRNRFLESAVYPTVTFQATSIEGLPEIYQDGQELQLQINGDLTIREMTRPVQFAVKLVHSDNTFTGEATTTILMSDFGFGPIDLAGILKTEDEVKVSLQFVARPAG